MMMLMGVRMSWLMLRRKCVLAWSAAVARSTSFSNCFWYASSRRLRSWPSLTSSSTTTITATAYTPKAEISIFSVCANTKSAGRNTYRLYFWYIPRIPKNVPPQSNFVKQLPLSACSSAVISGTLSTGRFHWSLSLLPMIFSPSVI